MFAFIFSMQHIPFGEEKENVIWNDLKMHVYIHTKGEKKAENMGHGYHKQAKQLKTFYHAQ